MLRPLPSAGTGEPAEHQSLIDDPLSEQRFTTTQLVIYLIGFSEGLTHLAALAIYYLFKDDLGLTPPQVSGVFIVPTIPWIIKPLFAFCSDSYPIFGCRRKPYIVIFSLFEAMGFVMLGAGLASGIIGAIIALFVISLSAAFCSATAEALVVETSAGKAHKGAADNVSDFVGSKAVGSLFVAYLSGYLLEKTSKQNVFFATALFPLLITAVVLFMKDDSPTPSRNIRGQFSTLIEFVKRPIIWGPALYIFIYMCGPDYDDALFFFFTNKLGFSPTFMGTLRFTYGIAAILGIVLYKYIFQQSSYRNVLVWTLILSFPIYISPIVIITGYNRKLGISNKMFVLSGGFLIEATAEIQLLPLLVLIASICPPGVEGSVYALMMSIRNLGGAVSRGLSAIGTYALGITATNFAQLTPYVLICGICLLLPLFCLSLIPTEEDIEKQKLAHKHSLEQREIYA